MSERESPCGDRNKRLRVGRASRNLLKLVCCQQRKYLFHWQVNLLAEFSALRLLSCSSTPPNTAPSALPNVTFAPWVAGHTGELVIVSQTWFRFLYCICSASLSIWAWHGWVEKPEEVFEASYEELSLLSGGCGKGVERPSTLKRFYRLSQMVVSQLSQHNCMLLLEGGHLPPCFLLPKHSYPLLSPSSAPRCMDLPFLLQPAPALVSLFGKDIRY